MKLLVSFALCQVPFGTRTFYSAIWRGEGVCVFCLWEFKGDNVWRGSQERWERLLGWGVFHATAGTEIVLSDMHVGWIVLWQIRSHASTPTLFNHTRKQAVGSKYWMTHAQNHTFFFCLRKFIKNNYLNVDRWFLPEYCSQEKTSQWSKNRF